MTPDIERMAREAGMSSLDQWWFGTESATLARLAALVAAAERERCAKVCESYAWLQEEGSTARTNFRNCAATIRAGG